ncbi:MAG: phenylalanine--tRNA ligase subunit beta [bacterium]|nr:phenylalanine--tRNA ligase subunit beta [bacterium]
MNVSYNWLQDYFDAKLPEPKKLAELFTAHVFEVEEIVERNNDVVFEFKILPDRAHYLLSHKGVAREAHVLTGLPLKDGEVATIHPAIGGIAVDIENKDLCRRYIAQEIRNVRVQDSPVWLKERLETVGQKSITTIVDAANYIMLDVGQPLHVFDAEKIEGQLYVRNAKKDESIVILSGQEIALTPDDLIIADDVGPLAIAGVKGGKRAEVTHATSSIIIESAQFEPTTVRKTSTRLHLRNDSSKRFENEITPALAKEGMARITQLISTLSPEAIMGMQRDIYPLPAYEREVVVTREAIVALIGMPVSEAQIETILSRMGCRIQKEENQLRITPPLDRFDLAIPEDIADEVGRIVGYETVPSLLPPDLDTTLLPDKVFFYGEKIKDVLVERGYSEVLLYSLVPKGVHEVVYPLASDKSALRDTLTTKLAEALVVNGRNADLLLRDTIKLCEVGNVFCEDGEKTMLAMGVLHVKKKKGTTSSMLLEEDVRHLEAVCGISLNAQIQTGEYGSILEVDLGKIVSSLPMQSDVSALQFKPLPRDKTYQSFSPYPFIVRDIAVFVPEAVEEADVYKVIKEHVGPLCVASKLFDVFNKEFPEGRKKSYAFRLVFQSFERTLEDKEVNEVMDVVYTEIERKTDWRVR